MKIFKLFENSYFSSPFFVLIKNGFQLSDIEILERLGIGEYSLITSKEGRQKQDINKVYLYFTEIGKWTHLMDDCYYLWHNKNIRHHILELSKDFEIFTFWLPDVDESYGFTYYKNGEIVRTYQVADPNFDGGFVEKDYGKPFTIEEKTLSQKVEFRGEMIAESLGIKFDYKPKNIRIYNRDEREDEKFFFNEDEY